MSAHKALQPFETQLAELVQASSPTAERRARAVTLRAELQAALDAHQLLQDNYASVAAQIRQVRDFEADTGHLSGRLGELDAAYKATNERVPRLVPALRAHCGASHARAQNRGRLDAVRRLRDAAHALADLERAVAAGRGADVDVLGELAAAGPSGAGRDGVAVSLTVHRKYLRTVAVEQITSAYAQAVSFSAAADGGHAVSVRPAVELQRTDSQKRLFEPGAPAGDRPQYTLPQLYLAMERVNALAPALHALHARVIRDLIRPLADADKALGAAISETASLRLLRVARPEAAEWTPRAAVDHIAAVLRFVGDAAVPVGSPGRDAFLRDLVAAASRVVLDSIIAPAMPRDVAALDDWAALVAHAREAEDALAAPRPAGLGVVAEFERGAMGSAWRAARDRRLFEELRGVVDQWDSWQAEQRPYVPLPEEVERGGGAVGVEGEEPVSVAEAPAEMMVDEEGEMEVEPADDGWGFAEETGAANEAMKVDATAEADQTAADVDAGDGDGWDFDDVAAAGPAAAPAPAAPAKPIRQAKRLGKKVERAGVADSETTSVASDGSAAPSVAGDDVDDGWAFDEPPAAAPAEPAKPVRQAKRLGKKVDKVAVEDAEADGGAVLDRPDEARVAAPTPPTQQVYAVSTACNVLLDVLRAYHADLVQLGDRQNAMTGSAARDTGAAMSAALDCFLALALAAYSGGAEPAHAVQLANDLHYLAAQLAGAGAGVGAPLKDMPPAARDGFAAASADLVAALVEHERVALDGYVDAADGLAQTADDARFRRCEREVGHVATRLSALAAAIKPLACSETYCRILGALVEHVLGRLVGCVTALPDIEELESNRLSDLLGSLLGLAALFDADDLGAVAAHVPVWLKFNYLIELLRANLVDITYLFDTGALVDFTPDELAALVRALFADSPKRAAVVDRIMGV